MNISDRILNGWNHPGPRPTIISDAPLRSYHEIIAFEANGQRVERNGEPVYAGDVFATSLVGRAMQALGTGVEWQAIYRD